jgi:threonine/homoserine/homoserine lactone efflux protein
VPDTQHLLLFIAAGWLLNLTPGPDVLYIVSNSLRSGAKSGIVAGLGITAGCFVHIFAAALGVGALLATSALAFVLLGVLFNLNAVPVNSGWALAAAWLSRRASVGRAALFLWLDRAAAAMFIGFGLKLALSDHPTAP